MEVDSILEEAKDEIKNFIKKNRDGIVIIWGATATGKSKLSILLSDFFDLEIISADSRQIFKYMDIGTDKINNETRKKIPHHQIDIVEPDDRYTAGERQHDTNKIIKKILNKKKLPIIVGGTGLYIDTIYKNFSMPTAEPDMALRKRLYDKEAKDPGILHQELMKVDSEEANKIHPKSIRYLVRALEIYYKTGEKKSESFFQQDVRWPVLMLGIMRDKEQTNRRINSRIKQMIKDGLIDEVKGLLEKGYDKNLQSMQGIGYKETVEYLEGKYDKDKLEEKIKRATHHLAKKQRTWFRRYIMDARLNPRKNVTYKIRELK